MSIWWTDGNSLSHALCINRIAVIHMMLFNYRCVWRFCIADNVADLKLLSAKEQIAQKIMRKARAGLERSKEHRLGANSDRGRGDPTGVGCEFFAKTMRQITSDESLRKETSQFSQIRVQEEHLRSHFEGIMSSVGHDGRRRKKGMMSSLSHGSVGNSSSVSFEPSSKGAMRRDDDDISTLANDADAGDAGSTFLTGAAAGGGGGGGGLSSNAAAATAMQSEHRITRQLSMVSSAASIASQVSNPATAAQESVASGLRSYGEQIMDLHNSFAVINAKISVSTLAVAL